MKIKIPDLKILLYVENDSQKMAWEEQAGGPAGGGACRGLLQVNGLQGPARG